MLKVGSGPLALTRRDFGVAALCGVLARPAMALVLPAAPRVVCRVLRDGRVIGSAAYDFQVQGPRLTVLINVQLRVRIGFITLFRYDHVNTEMWEGDRLVQFDARTVRNGVAAFARAKRTGGGLAVTGSAVEPYVAPPGAIGTSFWSARTLTAPLINAENGKMPQVRLVAAGPGEAVLSTGAKVAADEYRMTGDMRLNLWYDSGRNWAGMQYYAHDGSVLNYEKT